MAELMIAMDRDNRKESKDALLEMVETQYGDRGFDPAKSSPGSQLAMFESCKYVRW